MPETASSSGAPVPVAGIDIGSNSIRMVVAQISPRGEVEVLEQTQRAIRLGHDTFLTGELSQRAMSGAVAILRDYRKMLDTYGVKQMRAVATSAVRESSNADVFLDRIFVAVDLDVEVIEPSEEVRLIVSAVRKTMGNAFGLNENNSLICEVGGGSALLAMLEHGEIAFSGSYSLGSVRLQEILEVTGEAPERAADLLRHHIANVIAGMKSSVDLERVDTYVAVGGDARFAAHHVGLPGPNEDLHTIDVAAFDRLVEECARFTTGELARRYGMPFANAETLVPALLAYQALVHSTSAREIVVSSVSMRDGLLLDLAGQVTGVNELQLNDSILHAATSLGEKFHYDPKHAGHVAFLSVRLFDEIRQEHRLKPRYRLLLQVAAILHEIGGHVSNRSHHKHSYYLISNSEIFGLRRSELQIVAHTARYHRRSCPKPTHLEYMNLTRETRVIINKLAAILRVADALDRGHSQQIRDIHVERRQSEVVIYAQGVSDIGLERRALNSKADLFENVYGLKIRLEVSQAPLRQPAGPAGETRAPA